MNEVYHAELATVLLTAVLRRARKTRHTFDSGNDDFL